MHHSRVHPSLTAGDDELCPMPGDDIVLTVTVGGEVTRVAPTDLRLRMP